MERKSSISSLFEEVDLTGSPDIAKPTAKALIKSEPSRKDHRIYERFVRGPVPLDWICAAESLGGSALFVGMALWHYAGMNPTLTFRAGWKDLSLNRVSVSTVKRALVLLEKAGMIRVQRRSGKKNVIEIVDKARPEVRSEHVQEAEE